MRQLPARVFLITFSIALTASHTGLAQQRVAAASAATASLRVDSVTFQHQPAAVGEQSVQRFDCTLDLEMSIRQSGQVVQSQQQTVGRLQQRELKILSVGDEAPRQATVAYSKSIIRVSTGEEQHETEQPVTGKTYLVTKLETDLQVTYLDGTTPAEEELTIVTENLNSFGRANPIAQFFHGRTVRRGEVLQLPAELARDLVGFANTGDNVSQFHLKLTDIQTRRGQSPLAVFAIRMQAEDPHQSGVSMKLDGTMLMDADTCRSKRVELAGPVRASEMHGPEQAQYEVYSDGQIRVAVDSL